MGNQVQNVARHAMDIEIGRQILVVSLSQPAAAVLEVEGLTIWEIGQRVPFAKVPAKYKPG